MENEFYRIEKFKDRADFIKKAQSYLLYFNIARTNSGKENKTPWQLLKEKNTSADPRIPVFKVHYLDHLHENLLHNKLQGGTMSGSFPNPDGLTGQRDNWSIWIAGQTGHRDLLDNGISGLLIAWQKRWRFHNNSV